MRRDASFVVGIWLLSRAVILVSMLVIAPTLPQPADGHVAARSWSTFLYADGALYQSIVLDGYQYEKDRGTHPAYFPLYPLVAAPFVRFAHIPFAIVGPLLNGAAFLLALLALFAWTRARHGPAAARWTIATAAFLPLSIYGTLAYTEGLFLLLSTLALWSFERDRFAGAAVWGALASATRFPGLALMPAFALEAVLQKRSRGAWIAALCACAGTLAYALFCWRSFGDPFAFVHAQIAWRGPLTVRFADWEYMVAILLGTVGPHWWPYQIAIVALSALWWLKRGSFSDAGNFVCGLLLGLAEAALWFTSQWDLLLIVAGGAALVAFRKQLGVATTTYGLLGIAIILAAGFPLSADRIAYSIAPILIALGLMWERLPGVGAIAVAASAAALPLYAIKIAQSVWIP